MKSYYDVTVIVDGKEYKISTNYHFLLTCTKVGGWQLFKRWDGTEVLIGGEFESKEFIIKSGDIIVCGE